MHFAEKRLYLIYSETSIVSISTDGSLLVESVVEHLENKNMFDEFEYKNKVLDKAEGYFTKGAPKNNFLRTYREIIVDLKKV
ncbi:40088_t:CDS:2 [Gigaspora margarita]|uniref:40088_t:CDS:1 n=1 Tax=Gigaspora margarita TaxID=4874 RepID=A0ABN7UJH8_GIGMA|nr:40088_t:CDS:2 [Gigaspora margarita]